jgi:hypothetical protein
MKRFVLLFLLSAVLLLSACGSKSRLDGTYATEPGAGGISLTFQSNGKVTRSFMGNEVEGNYEVDGNKVKITGLPGAGTQVLTLLEDGSIQGGMGVKFTKAEKVITTA